MAEDNAGFPIAEMRAIGVQVLQDHRQHICSRVAPL
jgi:hypothetical protein